MGVDNVQQTIESTLDSKHLSSKRSSVLIIENDITCINLSQKTLEQAGFDVCLAQATIEITNLLQQKNFELILADVDLAQRNELFLLQYLRENNIRSTTILMSTNSSIDKALEVIKLGAYDYLAKPFTAHELLLTVCKAQERERLHLDNEILRDQISKRYSFTNLIAKSAAMSEIFETIKKIADYRTTVMIYGESGTGKELVARAIHYNSVRKNKRFVAINCGAIPENLLESELFGHKRGSFTDATRDKKGLFEEADGGTLLLDEVGELPSHLQVKLLRVLQEGQIRPVGDNVIIPVDVRIIAATLRDLENDILEGRFRDDLYYRLNVISIKIPPLRERKDDIPILINHFIKKNQDKLGLQVYGVNKNAMTALIEHTWPGNIRELENCIERSMILTDGPEITFASLPKSVQKPQKSEEPTEDMETELSIKVHMKETEQRLIKKALTKTHGNRTHAAKILEISHRTLLYKLKEYNLETYMLPNNSA